MLLQVSGKCERITLSAISVSRQSSSFTQRVSLCGLLYVLVLNGAAWEYGGSRWSLGVVVSHFPSSFLSSFPTFSLYISCSSISVFLFHSFFLLCFSLFFLLVFLFDSFFFSPFLFLVHSGIAQESEDCQCSLFIYMPHTFSLFIH